MMNPRFKCREREEGRWKERKGNGRQGEGTDMIKLQGFVIFLDNGTFIAVVCCSSDVYCNTA